MKPLFFVTLFLIAISVGPSESRADEARWFNFSVSMSSAGRPKPTPLVLGIKGDDVSIDPQSKTALQVASALEVARNFVHAAELEGCGEYLNLFCLAYKDPSPYTSIDCQQSGYMPYHYEFQAEHQKTLSRYFHIGGLTAVEVDIEEKAKNLNYTELVGVMPCQNGRLGVPFDVNIEGGYFGVQVDAVFKLVRSAVAIPNPQSAILPVQETSGTHCEYSLLLERLYGDEAARYPVKLSFNGLVTVDNGEPLFTSNRLRYFGQDKLHDAALFFLETTEIGQRIRAKSLDGEAVELEDFLARYPENNRKRVRDLMDMKNIATKNTEVLDNLLFCPHRVLFVMDAAPFAVVFYTSESGPITTCGSKIITMLDDGKFEMEPVQTLNDTILFFDSSVFKYAFREFIQRALVGTSALEWVDLKPQGLWPDPQESRFPFTSSSRK